METLSQIAAALFLLTCIQVGHLHRHGRKTSTHELRLVVCGALVLIMYTLRCITLQAEIYSLQDRLEKVDEIAARMDAIIDRAMEPATKGEE